MDGPFWLMPWRAPQRLPELITISFRPHSRKMSITAQRPRVSSGCGLASREGRHIHRPGVTAKPTWPPSTVHLTKTRKIGTVSAGPISRMRGLSSMSSVSLMWQLPGENMTFPGWAPPWARRSHCKGIADFAAVLVAVPIRDGYGIPLAPLGKLVRTAWSNDPATWFSCHGKGIRDELSISQMQKAMAIIQFKLEVQTIARNPSFTSRIEIFLTLSTSMSGRCPSTPNATRCSTEIVRRWDSLKL